MLCSVLTLFIRLIWLRIISCTNLANGNMLSFSWRVTNFLPILTKLEFGTQIWLHILKKKNQKTSPGCPIRTDRHDEITAALRHCLVEGPFLYRVLCIRIALYSSEVFSSTKDHIAMLWIMKDVGWWVCTEMSVARMFVQARRTRKMEALHSFETLVTIYDITQPYDWNG